MVIRRIFLTASLIVMLVLSLTPVGFRTASNVASAQGPSPTPESQEWTAYIAARTALEDKIQQNIQYIRNYEWAVVEWAGGITECKTLGEDEKPEFLFFGYRFVITLLNGNQYEIRTSLNSQIVVICDGVTNVGGAAAAAPAASGAPVTAPVGPGGLEVGGQVTGLYPEARTALNSAGMRWVKVQAGHSRPLDQVIGLINEAHGAGYKILISALGDISRAMDPAHQDEFANHLGAIAKAGADAIEVWNEPNIDREWPSGQVSGANYTQLLAKAYNAIKTNNPNTLVVSGAPAPTGFFGSAGCSAAGCNDDVFYQQMAAAGAAQYMDCVGVHYNEGIVSPTVSSGDPRDNYGTRYYGTNLARALGPFPGKQACITEIGYLSGEGYGGIPGGFAWAGDTSIAEHAQWLGEAVSIAKNAGNVRLLIVFNVDFKTYTEDPQAGYAIIRADGTCPACATIRAAIG